MTRVSVRIGFLVLLTAFTSGAVWAQTPAPAPVPASAVAADQGMQARLALAGRMADLMPPKDLVSLAIEGVVQNTPPNDRDRMRQRVTDAFDFGAFRQTVINLMAESFTETELQRMVDYNSTPEAKSISQKMPGYQAKLQRELVKDMDVAYMVARTGKQGEMPAAPAAPPAH